MNLFEWEKLTKDLCPVCRSRLFNQLQTEERHELIEKTAELYGISEGVKLDGKR